MIRKQIALLMHGIFPALLLVGGPGLVRAEADVVTTVGGESLQGTVTFRDGDALEVTSDSGQKERISLAELASVNLANGDPQWLIGGAGVLTANGSFLARPAVKMDEKVAILADQGGSLLLTRQNTAAFFFQTLRSRDAEALRFDREGVFLRGGDFMEGAVSRLEEGRVTVESVLLGQKSFAVETEAVAAVLRNPVSALRAWTLKLRDGSRLRCKDLKIMQGGVTLHGSPYRNYQVSRDQLVELRKGGAEPLIELFRSRWLALSGGRSLAVAALGDEASLADLKEARVGMEEKRVEREAAMNEAKAEWIRFQQIVSRLKAVASREASNVHRMQAQVQDKIRRVEQDQRTVQQADEDLGRKMGMVEQATTKVEETRKKLAAIPREDATRRRSVEQHVRNAERQKQNFERIVNQARAVQRRHVNRAKSSQRLVDMARERVLQAQKKKKEDDLAHQEAEESLGSAKSSYDLASSDLREVVTDLHRLDFLIQRKGVEVEK